MVKLKYLARLEVFRSSVMKAVKNNCAISTTLESTMLLLISVLVAAFLLSAWFGYMASGSADSPGGKIGIKIFEAFTDE